MPASFPLKAAFLLAISASVPAGETSETPSAWDGPEMPGAIGLDDECQAGRSGEGCAANAMQRRAMKVAAAEEAEANATGPSCASYGCSQHYTSWHSCHCNPSCERHGNCCKDYASRCKPSAQASCASHGCGGPYVQGRACQCTARCGAYGNCCSDYESKCKAPRPAPQPAPYGPEPASSSYRLDWSAQGQSFFDSFSFITEDMNHGSAHYLAKGQAMQEGVIEAHSGFAILRAGRRDPEYKYKRYSAKIATTRSWPYFIAAMRFSHVPFGCGVWPAFFTLAPGKQWPSGGEVDIMEFVNTDLSKTSFHSEEPCTLDAAEVNRYGSMPDRNGMDYNCKTAYPDHLGCAPNKWMKSGQGWANSPGVIALERSRAHVKIFFWPEGSIPGDLLAGDPQPESWDNSFLMSYYPFQASGCSPSVMTAQQLLLNIGFCGDWAGKTWGLFPTCKAKVHGCRSVDPLKEYAPDQDCCTQFIYDEDGSHGTDGSLQREAFFNISWMKVFTPGR